jgi:hypothetical protein
VTLFGQELILEDSNQKQSELLTISACIGATAMIAVITR